MAFPTITSNSPVAGSISWTEFGLTFNGVDYRILAGNSARKFIWWEYRGGVPAMVDGDTLPTLAPEDLLLFLNKAGIGLLAPMTDVVDGSLIVSGSILAGAIGANQIQSTHIGADQVTATQIAANAVTASELNANAVTAVKILAGAVTASKLSVGSVGDSLVTNGSFEDVLSGVAEGWTPVTQTGGTISIVTGVASSGLNALRLAATATTATIQLRQAASAYIPVTATTGRKWYVSMNAGAGTATTRGAYLRCDWYTDTKAYISSTDVVANAALTTSFQIMEGQVTPPSTARFMAMSVLLINPNVVTNMYVDEVVAREVVVSAVIGDGQISTPKLAAGAVTADTIGAGAITADKLDVNAVTADKIAAGAIVAGKIAATAIDGMTLTGATVRTSADTAAARWNMDGTGLKGYGAGGVEYFSGTSTGVSITGSLRATGGSGFVAGTPLVTTLGNWGTDKTPGVYFENTSSPLGVNDVPAGMISNFGNGVMIRSRKYGDGTDARVAVSPSTDNTGGEILISADNSLSTGTARIMLSYQNGAKLVVNNKNIESLAVTFSNSFANHSAGQPMKTSRVSADRVQISGMLTVPSNTYDVIVGTVAAGHRPAVKQFLPCVTNSAGSQSFYPGVITVESTGTIRYRSQSGAGTGGYIVIAANYEA